MRLFSLSLLSCNRLCDSIHISVEPGIGGKSPTVTEPQFTTGDRRRPWLLIAIRNSPDTRNSRH